MAVPGDCRNTVCISKSPGAVMGKQIYSKPYESLCESAQRALFAPSGHKCKRISSSPPKRQKNCRFVSKPQAWYIIAARSAVYIIAASSAVYIISLKGCISSRLACIHFGA